MKRTLAILLGALYALCATSVVAQVLNPVTWSGEQIGDSVRITATIDSGWHMTLISIGEQMFGEEYTDSFSVTLAQPLPVRFNACDDKSCTAPEIWEFRNEQFADTQSAITDGKSLWVIFLLGLLGGFLAIFTPCVWPIIPMTVSFFLKKGGGIKDAVLYDLWLYSETGILSCQLAENGEDHIPVAVISIRHELVFSDRGRSEKHDAAAVCFICS